MHRIAVAALVAFAALAATATGAHWPMFGGDAGRSGHQPVDAGGPPITQRYSITEPSDQEIKTSPVVTGGAPVDAWRLAYGTQQADPVDAFAHEQRLVSGAPIGSQQGIDIGHDAPVRDTDHFTGAGGSVTPVDTSVPGDPGALLFLHNDDDQDGFSTLGDNSRDPRTGDDIALAIVDVESGQLISDKAIGTNNPEAEDTINMTVSSSPVMGPYTSAQVPTRDIYFVAERAAAEVSPEPATGTPCNPDQVSFEEPPATEQPAPGGPTVTLPRSCNIPAQRKLFKVTISNPTSPTAAISAIKSVEIGAQLNVLSNPTLVRLADPASAETPQVRTYVAVGTNDGFLRTYDAGTLAAGPVSPDLGNVVNTAVVPVRSDGNIPEADPPIYVTATTAATTFKAYKLQRVESPAPALRIVDATRDQSGTLTGVPAVAQAPAVSAAGENVPAGGRLVITTDKNLYSLNANDLAQAQGLDVNNALAAGTTGFSRTSPALQGGLVYVQRDNGEQLVVDETTLAPVGGFTPFADASGGARGSNEGIGQPAIAAGFIAFGNRDGAFVYRNQNAPTVEIVAPPEGATLSGTVTLRATAYNMRSGVEKVVFLLNGIEAGEGVLVSGSPTSPTSPGVYELNLDTKTFGNGKYQLTARATDADTGADAPAEARTSAGRGVTIVNEVPTQLSVGDVRVAEGDAGTRDATFTITKTGPNGTTVTVRTRDLTATAPADYGTVATEVTFAPGEESKTISVPVFGDTAHEEDETFAVVLLGPTGGAGLADGSGLGIITNDDPAGPGPNDPVVSVSSASVGEGGPRQTRRMTFDVSLSRPVGAPVTVSFATADQTAQTPTDYRAASGTLTFEPGQLTRSFTVTVVGDDRVEGNEVFLVRLSDAVGAGLGNATGTGQIVDDEVARGARQRPSSLTLRLKPERDRRAPFRFTATGNLIVPAGLSPLAACQGRVAVQVKAGRKTISTRRVQVRSNCTFRSTVTFRDRKRFTRGGRLEFRARFAGNGLLKARSSKRVGARTR